MRSKLLRVLALISMLSMLAAPVGAQPLSGHSPGAVMAPVFDDIPDWEPVTDVRPYIRPAKVLGETKGATEPANYIVMFDESPVASYTGGIAGLAATSPRATGAVKLDASSSASVAYANYLGSKHASFLSSAEGLLGRSLTVLYDYRYAFNGLALNLTPSEAATIAGLQGVRQVQKEFLRFPQTDVGPAWIGAPGIWNGTTTGGLPGTEGEGVVVGIIDTGLNLDHPSFAEVGPIDGYTHVNPLGSGVFLGLCLSDPGTYVCNDKLIGYYIYTGETGDDTDGHGTHTGSTTAGNYVTATLSITATNPYTYTPVISGVAPHATVIGYDACTDGGGCGLTGLVAAIDQTVIDGVDVINYSIGGGTSDPWSDSDSLAFLAATDAGIVPVTSAGNSGPGAGTMGSPGDAPWLFTVGASTHNRADFSTLQNMSGGDTTPPSDLTGLALSVGYGPAPIVYAGDFGDALCENPFAAGTWTSGEIVVCDRGAVARVAKGFNAWQGGAGGVILANVSAGQSVNADPHYIPAVHLNSTDGDALRAWLASGTGHMATISGTSLDFSASNGDVMAGFSSRGPNVNNAPDIVKPDVTAPGVSILAAYRSGSGPVGDAEPWMSEYNYLSGTSMSSPHTAGAAALMKALYPAWSPAQIKSALMTTGLTSSVVKEDGVTPADPFDMGGGRVHLAHAGEAGLVLDETKTNFENADPGLGGDPKTLNLPSLGNANCVGSCSWTREVENALSTTATWSASASAPPTVTLTVSPTMFTLAPGATQVLDITADVTAATVGQWVFGEVNLSENGAQAPDAHLPVAVKPSTGTLPSSLEITTRRDAGSEVIKDNEAIEITALTTDIAGLTLASSTIQDLALDPTNGDPYDMAGGTFVVNATVPANTARLVAEITDSEAPDIDLYVGQDLDADGPEASEQLCSSTTGSFLEYCNLRNPAAGTYWILVQNWAASGSPPDSTTLLHAVVPDSDAGNMTVSGPSSVPAGTLFDLTVFYDEPAMEFGDRAYGAFSVGSSPSSPGDVGTVDVNIVRIEDDVSKVVDNMYPTLGTTVTYTITVQPNITAMDQDYAITDTIPTGLTYVPGSATANFGSVSVISDTVVWTGTMPTPVGAGGNYNVTTSATDPMCDTGFGGYVNLADFGIFTQAGITGDTVGFSAFTSGDPIAFYGTDYVGTGFVDDGYAVFDIVNQWVPAPTPWTAQTLPDATLPNNVAASYWHDFEIFYDLALNHGVSLATAGAPGGVIVIEYDDIQLFGGSAPVTDMEIVIARDRDDTPGFYEVVFAYDNVSTTLPTPATIGVENALGDAAATLVNNSDPTGVISDGFMVCFDYAGASFDPAVITYQVTADALGAHTNAVDSIVTTDAGSKVETVKRTIWVGIPTFFPFIPKN